MRSVPRSRPHTVTPRKGVAPEGENRGDGFPSTADATAGLLPKVLLSPRISVRVRPQVDQKTPARPRVPCPRVDRRR